MKWDWVRHGGTSMGKGIVKWGWVIMGRGDMGLNRICEMGLGIIMGIGWVINS
jgi:hypothetical protein